jgi:hypothetical protein
VTHPSDDLQRQADRLTDANRVSGLLSQSVTEDLASDFSSGKHIGADEFESVSDEEYRDLGYDPDDPYGEIVIKRKRDDAYFELEVDVTAHPVRQKTEADR